MDLKVDPQWLLDKAEVEAGKVISAGGLFYGPKAEKVEQPPTEYMLVDDDEGQWYVIPVNKLAEFGQWKKQYEKWLEELLEDTPGDEPAAPDWAVTVGGSVGLLRFPAYRIEGQ